MNINELRCIYQITEYVDRLTAGAADLEVITTRLTGDDLVPNARVIAATFTGDTYAQRYYFTVHQNGTIEQWQEAPVQGNIISKREITPGGIAHEIYALADTNAPNT